MIKFLKSNDFIIQYQDDNEIYATGKIETKYRSWFMFFFNTKYLNCMYDVKIDIKDNKIKFNGSNYLLFKKNVGLSSYSWYKNPSEYKTSAWSTTNIPSEIRRIPVDVHYEANKTKRKFALFQDLNKKMTGLINSIKEYDDDWK